MKRFIGLLAATATCVVANGCAFTSADEPVESTSSESDELRIGDTFDRIVQGRAFIEGERTLPLEEGGGPNDVAYADRVANAFARFHPTYVSNLVRHNQPLAAKGETALTPAEIHAYAVIREKMPQAKVDVVVTPVNAGNKLSKKELLDLMQNIQETVHPDIWFFDFFTDGDPDVVRAAIEWAHSTEGGKKKQLVGGHYFGGLADARGTEKADFYAVVDDACGHLDQDKIDALRKKKPVLVHANNNAQNDDKQICNGVKGTLSCHFLNDWSFAKKKAYAEDYASHQRSGGYKYMYNVFFPGCPLKTYYDSVHDVGPGGQRMIDVLVNLAERYD